jgi:hypothetical protein
MRDMVTSAARLSAVAFACATGLALGAAACGHPTARQGAPTPDARITQAEHVSLYTSVPEPAGTRCRWGGVKTGTGPDLNGNGVLERQEVTTITYACTERRAPRPAFAARRR